MYKIVHTITGKSYQLLHENQGTNINKYVCATGDGGVIFLSEDEVKLIEITGDNMSIHVDYFGQYPEIKYQEGVGCIHQMCLTNQGIHWCELQQDCYPKCEGCPKFEKRLGAWIYSI